eukprot:CAMPEP_0206134492 /NCGR_PEP_ID=MMETSP1473-20131121/40_1 /ASSEMBLY_ACC=CAM_ASM_001109 /TAXON_ID=1461547 /ORGANISM="Stichococcus sp, Strain RCC1054" /LENGTH=42 /DNA_ID= /DNA_START= /DNA_END= /DNA_ORIENTATION=
MTGCPLMDLRKSEGVFARPSSTTAGTLGASSAMAAQSAGSFL